MSRLRRIEAQLKRSHNRLGQLRMSQGPLQQACTGPEERPLYLWE